MARPGTAAREFVRVWGTGLRHPSRALDEVAHKPAPWWGLAAVTVRFGITSLTTVELLRRKRRSPFWRSYLPFLPAERYYAAERFFLPAFGLGAWLAMGGLAHGVLHRSGKPASFARVLNLVGMGMLIPMPPLWIWDWSMIALDRDHLPEMAVSHTVVEAWEAAIFAVGFHRVMGLPWGRALALGHGLGGLYIALANPVVR